MSSESISIDRVALPIDEPIEAGRAGGSAVGRRGDGRRATTYARGPGQLDEIEREASRRKAKIARNFHMAYAAPVTLHDAEGEAIHTNRGTGSRG
jgi:hypothetical protein